MHQVHHACNIEYMDKNHGGILNIFDRVFGTWKELDENVDIAYGVTSPPGSYNLWVILTHEYSDIWRDIKKSENLWHKLMYVFGPPGWSHDGSTQNVKEIRKEMALIKRQMAKQNIPKPLGKELRDDVYTSGIKV